jgi:heterodisulfide reductase subunit C
VSGLPNTTDLASEVLAEPGGEKLRSCVSCGTCVATCAVQWWNPTYNPRRILHMVSLNQREAVLQSPTIWFCSACDQCYNHCPQGVRLSDLMKALRTIALRDGIRPGHDIAKVNERICSACGRCTDLCPYKAVSLQERKVLGVQKKVAAVDPVRCMQCGVCVAACRAAAIQLPGFSAGELLAEVRDQSHEQLPPVEARE